MMFLLCACHYLSAVLRTGIQTYQPIVQPLEPPHKQQDEQDQKDQAKPATGVVTPLFAVRPRGECANKHQNYDDD